MIYSRFYLSSINKTGGRTLIDFYRVIPSFYILLSIFGCTDTKSSLCYHIHEKIYERIRVIK